MMDDKQLWSLAEEAFRAFSPFYRQAMQQAIQDSGAPEQWFPLSLARGSHPAPLSLERFRAMSPFASQERLVELLEALARQEMLERVGKDAYRLTDLGREAVEEIYGAAHQNLETIAPLAADEMEQLNALLYRLVQATLEEPEPQEKWAVIYSRWTDPDADAASAAKTDQYLTDLYRFRDDAHNAAWKPYQVSGHVWEALTLLWRDEAHAAAELVEQRPYRGYSEEMYAKALEALADRGWAQKTSAGYHITEEGRALRQEAEEATDRYFYAPWACLKEAEKERLSKLLTQLKVALEEMAADIADDTT